LSDFTLAEVTTQYVNLLSGGAVRTIEDNGLPIGKNLECRAEYQMDDAGPLNGKLRETNGLADGKRADAAWENFSSASARSLAD
jgi:hypothetical protein